MTIRRYTPADRPAWDAFVEASRNATFLHMRGYMDYHADRFADHSLLFFDTKGHLRGLLPANEETSADAGTKVLWSHHGLTYGGLLLSMKETMETVLQIFDALMAYLRAEGFAALSNKQVPQTYHRYPSQEDDYALWRHGAVLDVCNISVAVDLRAPVMPAVKQRRRHGWTMAAELGYRVAETTDLASFWPIVEANLWERHGVRPVHSLQEIELLHSRFPRNIRCFVATVGEGEASGVEAGAIIYESRNAIHVQYTHATPRGREDGAQDAVLHAAMEYYRAETAVRYFDFGISNEQAGRYLNEGLISQKEGFGARGVAYRIFRIDL